MAFQGLTKQPKNFKFIVDGYNAYLLTAMKFGKDFTFKITQLIGLSNNDAVSTKHHLFKQMIKWLDHTYKAFYCHTNGFDNIDDAGYTLPSGSHTIYNFLRLYKHNKYKVLNKVKLLQNIDNVPGK